MSKPTGLVLTGGGLTGICAEVGALMALVEEGCRFDAVIGTSAGAIVGALYTAGVEPSAIAVAVSALKKNEYLDPVDDLKLALKLKKRLQGLTGYYQGQALLAWLEKHLPKKLIEECDPPLYLTVTNVSRGIPQVKSAGPLARYARASSAIPLVFEVQRVDGEYYADGGAANNIPVDELASLRPDLEQFLVVSALSVLKDTPPIDNSFLQNDWSPARALGRVINAIAEGQRLDNLNVPQKVVVLRVKSLSLDLDEVARAGEAIELAYAFTKSQIAEGKLDLSDVPRG